MDEYKNLVNQKTSALSSLGNANRQALKYADNTALAQGYATQGARLQNMGNLQNAYLNQVGGVNQQFQQQLGNLENTASKEALNNYQVNVENAIANNTLTQEELNKLQNAYFGRLSSTDITEAENYTRQALSLLNNQSQVNQTTGNSVFNSTNGQSYETSATNVDGKKGADFEVVIGSRTYNVQLGGEVNDTNLNPNDYEVGKLYLYQDTNGNLNSKKLNYLITKDKNGKIRVVTDRAFGKGYKQGIGGERAELYNIAKNLGLLND